MQTDPDIKFSNFHPHYRAWQFVNDVGHHLALPYGVSYNALCAPIIRLKKIIRLSWTYVNSQFPFCIRMSIWLLCILRWAVRSLSDTMIRRWVHRVQSIEEQLRRVHVSLVLFIQRDLTFTHASTDFPSCVDYAPSFDLFPCVQTPSWFWPITL